VIARLDGVEGLPQDLREPRVALQVDAGFIVKCEREDLPADAVHAHTGTKRIVESRLSQGLAE
jgi:hypothetical protein